MRSLSITLLIAAAVALSATSLLKSADEAAAKKPADAAAGATAAASTAAPDAAAQAKMMEQMMKLAAPGPEHEKLKAMVGKWKADVTVIMPGAPEEKSTGTMNNEMIMGGRYLYQTYEGTMMKMPFKGGGVVGYDNVKKKYVSVWIDEMSTQIMMSEGTMDESAKTITMTAAVDCPMDNSKHTMRQVVTMTDDDHHTYEMFDTGPDGKETKCLTIKYTRVKEQQ